MLEIALRANSGQQPIVMVMDSRTRLERANEMLNALIKVGFLVDQDEYKKELQRKDPTGEEPKLTEYKVTSTDYVGDMADLRRLVTPAGLAWLRASSKELDHVQNLIDGHPKHPHMCARVREIYGEFGFEKDLQPDGRPIIARIWRVFYDAQLFASGTHYICFDQVELKARPVIATLGSLGTIFINGSTDEHQKIVSCIQDGHPMLLLESTGGVAQAFSYIVKAVRMMKPKWDIDFVLRLITEYKQRAAKENAAVKERLPVQNRKYVIENISLLDKELARIDLILSSGEHVEPWMRNFGLPEVLMLFEIWQRSPDFLMNQCQRADVMKLSAEDLLETFTNCFSGGAGGVPELGLGPAQTKVVQTAWNRHLILFNNAAMYSKRSWIMEFTLYFLAILTTTLSIITSNYTRLQGIFLLETVMLVLPITSALFGTIATRLRQKEKFSVCKMASYEIVSEIYKFRVRAIEYEGGALAAALQAAKSGGGAEEKKKKDDEPVAPISGKEKDRAARQKFVERVQNIYSACLESEMSKGTSVSHKTGGMDPQRLLLEEDGDQEKETRDLLRQHVSGRLYFITVREWAKTAEVVKAENLAVAAKNRSAAAKALKRKLISMVRGVLSIFVNLFSAVILALYAVAMKVSNIARRTVGVEDGAETKKPAALKPAVPAVSNGDEDAVHLNPAEKIVYSMKRSFNAIFAVANGKEHSVDEEAGEDEHAEEEHLGVRNELLDTTYIEEEEGGAAGGGGEGGAEGGGDAVLRIRDDLLGNLSIIDYMTYRARPILTYFQRQAPWRAFELQCLEIIVFTINSAGAVLVGLGNDFIPYVALTVGIAAVCKSFMEFSRLSKQVEAYNKSMRDIHNLINSWDGMTATERRTRQTITTVVGTVEQAMLFVAMALTDAIPSGQSGGDGDGEEGEAEE